MRALHRACRLLAGPLAGAEIAVWADRYTDVQTLQWPVLAALAVCVGVVLLGLGKVCAE